MWICYVWISSFRLSVYLTLFYFALCLFCHVDWLSDSFLSPLVSTVCCCFVLKWDVSISCLFADCSSTYCVSETISSYYFLSVFHHWTKSTSRLLQSHLITHRNILIWGIKLHQNVSFFLEVKLFFIIMSLILLLSNNHLLSEKAPLFF